ncbi:MAG: hypothetical protein HN929_05945 [Chloroflexi bacterium]|jgi:hypothetical protein|nr:hypothetical protein [Chloroflexota bacterium]
MKYNKNFFMPTIELGYDGPLDYSQAGKIIDEMNELWGQMGWEFYMVTERHGIDGLGLCWVVKAKHLPTCAASELRLGIVK